MSGGFANPLHLLSCCTSSVLHVFCCPAEGEVVICVVRFFSFTIFRSLAGLSWSGPRARSVRPQREGFILAANEVKLVELASVDGFDHVLVSPSGNEVHYQG